MRSMNFLIVSVFLVSILAIPGMLFGQRVIDLDKVWGDMRVLGAEFNDHSGWEIACGDINGDGYMDIIIGAPYANPGGRHDAGETYIVFGADFITPIVIDLSTESADITVYGDDAGDRSGGAVASGDINSDGYGDIIIGASVTDPRGGVQAGETYVIFGDDFTPPIVIDLSTNPANITVYGDDADDRCGQAVASGDVNGDGYDDMLIGAPGADHYGYDVVGETYVIFGDSFPWPPYTIDLDCQSAGITICGDDDGDLSGSATASGDVNDDGYHDIIIGAYSADTYGGINSGETYVIFGSSSPPATIDLHTESADITIYGDDANDESGFAVASGDINNDGYHDIIIAAPCADRPGGTDAGETYVIFGGEIVPIIIDVVAGQGPGAASYARDFNALNGNLLKTFKAFGPGNANGEVSVAKGDVTGDGVPDIVVVQRSLGASSYVRVFTQDGGLLWTFRAFGPGNTNGMVNVAVGDVDRDGVGEIVVSQGPGGQSYVRIFKYDNPVPVTTWRAFDGKNVSGEVRVAAGRTAGGGYSVGQIITGHGHGGESYVRVWDYGTPPILYKTFKAFGPGNASGGVDVGVGNFDGDPSGRDLIVVGQGGSGETTAGAASSYIRVFTEYGILLKTRRAFGDGNTNGRVTVSGGQADGDTADEIIVGQAIGGDSYWRAFNYDGSLIRTVKAFGGGNTKGQIDVAGASKLKSGGGKSEQR